MSAKLGPKEGIHRLQHPDCRACKERERLNVGLVAENIDLRKAVRELQNGERRGEIKATIRAAQERRK